MLYEHLFLSCFKLGLTERQVHAFAWTNPICSLRLWSGKASHCDQQVTTNSWSQGPQSAAVPPASGYSSLATALVLSLAWVPCFGCKNVYYSDYQFETLVGSSGFEQGAQYGFLSAGALWTSLPFACFTWLEPLVCHLQLLFLTQLEVVCIMCLWSCFCLPCCWNAVPAWLGGAAPPLLPGQGKTHLQGLGQSQGSFTMWHMWKPAFQTGSIQQSADPFCIKSALLWHY